MFIIAKGQKKLNSFTFNALAIISVLVILPFATAIITQSSQSTDSDWVDSMKVSAYGEPNTGSYWIENGGKNYTGYYKTLNPALTTLEEDCGYITEGFCQGYNDPPIHKVPVQSMYFGNGFRMPMTSVNLQQSHYYISNGSQYIGMSGELFSWKFDSQYFSNLKDNTTTDSFSFTFIDKSVNYAEGAFNASDISFYADIEFSYDGDVLPLNDFFIETTNQYCFFDPIERNIGQSCYIGLQVTLKFTMFQALEIFDFNYGNWTGTEIQLTLKNFEVEDYPNFGGTYLPFAGDGSFDMGIEHTEINPRESGFFVKGGTLGLGIAVFIFALASTPYWDPFKQAFRGSQ